MTKLTLFDAIKGDIIFSGSYCPYCDNAIDLDKQQEIVMEVFQGQFGHLVIHSYHAGCLQQRTEAFRFLSNVLDSDT